MQWRDMTAEEVITRPEARLGGTLALMFWIALALAVVPPLGLVLDLAFVALGSIHSGPGVWLIGFYGGPVEAGLAYMTPIVFSVAGCWVFVIMTILRAKATPTVASAGMIIWVTLRFAPGYLSYLFNARDPFSTWPYAASILTEIIMTVAFCGYMATGVRPNAYYRRRLPG